MPIVSQGNSVVVDVGAHDGLWIKSTGSAEVTVNQVYAGTPEVFNVTTDTVRVGFYGEPVTVSIRAVSGSADYQSTPYAYEKLSSAQQGDRSDSSSLDVAQAVNNLQDGTVGFDAITLKGLPNTPGAPAGYGDLASAVNRAIRRVVTPYDYGLTNASTEAQATAAFQAMFDANSSDTEFRFSGEITLSSISITNKTRCKFSFEASRLRFTSSASSVVFDEVSSSYIMFGEVQPQGARSGSDVGVKFVGLTENVISFMAIGGFTKPIQINPIGAGGARQIDGYYYNNLTVFEIGSEAVTTTAVEITTTTASQPSYVNENEFRLMAIDTGNTGVKFIKGAGQADPFNGNTFFRTGFERVVNIGFDLAFCNNNYFVYPRFESQYAANRFNTALIRDASDCGANTFELGMVRGARLLIDGQNSTVNALMLNEAQSIYSNGYYTSNTGLPRVYVTRRLNSNVNDIANLSELITGNSLATDNNKPFAKYLRYIKGSDGVFRGAGFVQPYEQNSITSWTNGQVIEAGLSSFIRIQNGTAGNVLNLRMHVDREINGFFCLLEITNLATEVNIQNSAGTQQVAFTAFQTGGDARGLFMLVYRDFGWRVSQLGGTLKNA